MRASQELARATEPGPAEGCEILAVWRAGPVRASQELARTTEPGLAEGCEILAVWRAGPALCGLC